MPKTKITKSDLNRMGKESYKRTGKFTPGKGDCPGNKMLKRNRIK